MAWRRPEYFMSGWDKLFLVTDCLWRSRVLRLKHLSFHQCSQLLLLLSFRIYLTVDKNLECIKKKLFRKMSSLAMYEWIMGTLGFVDSSVFSGKCSRCLWGPICVWGVLGKVYPRRQSLWGNCIEWTNEVTDFECMEICLVNGDSLNHWGKSKEETHGEIYCEWGIIWITNG